MQNFKTFLENLSSHPGVYQMLDAQGNILYVGKAKNLKKRITSYFSRQLQDSKTLTMIKHVCDIDITVTNSETEAVLLECNLIKKHRPRYNVLLRDDKSYPYILITIEHGFPRIDLYRGQRKKTGLYFGPYPSAYAVRETISLLQRLFRLRTCQDSVFEARNRPCLLYQIGRCTGPCVGLVSHEDYAENIRLAVLFLQGKRDEVIHALQENMENAARKLDFELAAQYRNQIRRLHQIIEKQYVTVKDGNADVIGYASQAGVVCIQLLTVRHGQVLGSRAYFPSVPDCEKTEEIITAFLTQHYLNHPSHVESIPRNIIIEVDLVDHAMTERALTELSGHRVSIVKSKRGEKKKWLEMANRSASESLVAHLFTKTNMHGRASALQKLLKMEEVPDRIECFDVSHSHGEATVASCVVFDQNGPIKSLYRRFNIKEVAKGDDVAAMKQVLTRRYKRLLKEEIKLPDIILIDGGLTQLNAAHQILQSLNIENVLLLSVSKGPDRKPGFETIHRIDEKPIHLPRDELALHFIQQIRDEAHRFAVTGHRNRRDKARVQSSLELIQGIGSKRRRDLLRYFGGIQGLARASLDDIMKVPGINRSLAERIFATLHDTNN